MGVTAGEPMSNAVLKMRPERNARPATPNPNVGAWRGPFASEWLTLTPHYRLRSRTVDAYVGPQCNELVAADASGGRSEADRIFLSCDLHLSGEVAPGMCPCIARPAPSGEARS